MFLLKNIAVLGEMCYPFKRILRIERSGSRHELDNLYFISSINSVSDCNYRSNLDV